MMDPNIYMAYLCFLENDSAVCRTFKHWSFNTSNYQMPLVEFHFALRTEAEDRKWEAKNAFIYEYEDKWKKFSPPSFVLWLEECGFKK